MTIENVFQACDKLESIFAPFNKKYCAICDDLKNKEYIEQANREYPHIIENKKKNLINRGCCTTCASANGWLSIEEACAVKDKYFFLLTKQEFYILKSLFWYNNDYGFFNPDKLSCNIPRALRSTTCLTHGCYKTLWEKDITPDIIKEIQNLIIIICDYQKNNFNWFEDTINKLYDMGEIVDGKA